jgi:DNA-binding transcriptional MocR family regulator
LPAENLITKACFQDASKPRYLAIADELAQNILSGQLPAGERLPPQRKLAQRLEVTAGTVSHAYALLEQRGLATARVGDGTYVRAPEKAPARADSAAPVDLAHNVAIPTDDGTALAHALQRLAADPVTLREVLSYQAETGHLRHRQAGAQWLRRFGTEGDASRVMVTHGAQHGLSCVLRTLARPGDALLTESLSYPGLQALARTMRLQLVGIAMDEQGMLPDALDHAARHIDTKLLFCAPSLHNPTNASMSMQRREAIAQVARRHSLLLIEDAVHAAAQAAPLPAVSTLLPDQSFLLASFSKVAGPGLRVGYIEAAPLWLGKLSASMRADCWMVAPLLPEIASDWIASGVAEQLVAAQRAAIRERLAVALPLLRGLEHRSNPESPLIWLPLPESWRAGPFSAALRQAGVLVRTADHFAVGRAAAPHAVRISLNAAKSGSEIENGIRTLVRLLRDAPPAQP